MIESIYPCTSIYKTEILINGHLKQNWNCCLTKFLAINQIIIGLLIFILGIFIVFFQLALFHTSHGIWTGVLVFISGLLAFLTIIYRHHHYFLFVACIHIVTGLVSTILIILSIFALVFSSNNDQKFNYAFHITLILLGFYEKLVCYTFLLMIIRHTHKMV